MKRNKGKTHWVAMGLLLGFVFLFVVLFQHQVILALTASDEAVFKLLFPERALLGEERSYETEIEYIIAVQNKALEISPKWEGIPFGETREPADLLRLGQGICYDRCRFIEKALTYFGFQVRHVAIYEKLQGGWLHSLRTPRINSHSASEVKTSRGWIYVDSNFLWISNSDEGNPVSLDEIYRNGMKCYFRDSNSAPDIIRKKFVMVYGLYGRHGNFYPPFDAIPDVSWKELLYNF